MFTTWATLWQEGPGHPSSGPALIACVKNAQAANHSAVVSRICCRFIVPGTRSAWGCSRRISAAVSRCRVVAHCHRMRHRHISIDFM